MDAKQLHSLADTMYGKALPLRGLWQELADQFYPERADFTIWRPLGTDFAANLMTSYPIQCRRDLANQFSTMLRPTARPWFHLQMRHEDRKSEQDLDIKRWLQWFEDVQRRAMYDRVALFNRATSEADHDFAAFGQCGLSVELNRARTALLYRTWHLRDMVWQNNEEGMIGTIFRKWKPTAQTLMRTFPKSVHEKIGELVKKTPFEEVECLHMVVDADMYDDDARGKPRWSIWYDTQNTHVMEAVPIWGKHYIIPRWQTVSSAVYGSQYSFSPATVAALPDARLIQAMTYTLLEAGEKATQPPMVATQDAIKSDVSVYAGGVTWVDAEYDERLGEALRPLTQDFRGFNFGVELNRDTRELILKSFYLDKLTMPQRTQAMTAYEVSQRVQEYIRDALPLFGPMETEYNAALCDETFDLLMRNGAFGNPGNWPKKLRGASLDFTFESPLHDAIEEQKVSKYQQAVQLVSTAIGFDPASAATVDFGKALREALLGSGAPAEWLRSEIEVKDEAARQAQQQRAQQTLASLEQGSKVVQNLGGPAALQQMGAGGAGKGGAPAPAPAQAAVV
jgi:hypothetical protein